MAMPFIWFSFSFTVLIVVALERVNFLIDPPGKFTVIVGLLLYYKARNESLAALNDSIWLFALTCDLV